MYQVKPELVLRVADSERTSVVSKDFAVSPTGTCTLNAFIALPAQSTVVPRISKTSALTGTSDAGGPETSVEGVAGSAVMSPGVQQSQRKSSMTASMLASQEVQLVKLL